jgi:glycosyltransferase involved in cell wall biosynthesis
MNRTVLLVIPCFREAERIRPLLEDLVATFGDGVADGLRVLMVDDGSGPEAQEALLRTAAPVITGRALFLPPLLLPQNVGKGGAVYAGWRQNSGEELLAFVDADRSITAAEVKRLLALARENGSRSKSESKRKCESEDEDDNEREGVTQTAFFGSRVKMLGRTVERQFKRHLIGRVYATLVSEMLDIPVYDSQCGFKLVPRVAYEAVAERLKIQRFAFDVDLLVALTDAGVPVVEVPIDWHEEPGGKVNLIKDSWRMFRDILMIRERRKRGRLKTQG